MSIVKLHVCTSCESPSIIDTHCRCMWDNKYPTIELEFEQCDHCGHIEEQPAETEFNHQQWGTNEDEKKEEEND